MTCHNRRKLTVECLQRLFSQDCIRDINLNVYLVDAGSTDGTVEAIRQKFPDVKVIEKDDKLYWCGGMRVAFEHACKGNYDYYLWLNDDSMLYVNALGQMLTTARNTEPELTAGPIVVGCLCDPVTGQYTYGGHVRPNPQKPVKFEPVIPNGCSQKCDTINGNCVLVPRHAINILGNLSSKFSHRMGDTDYGLRAISKGIDIFTTPEYIGTCPQNPPAEWLDPEVPISKRLKLLRHPKGPNPQEWAVFTKRHVGWKWPFYVISLYCRIIFPNLRKSDKDK